MCVLEGENEINSCNRNVADNDMVWQINSYKLR